MAFYTMADGEQLYVREIGQGQPVLILSGLGMSSWQWLPFIASHLKTHKFYIPDFRGFGGSKNCKIPQHLSAIESHWQDLTVLLPQLNIPKFKLIAYSMGATTTMHGLKYGNFSNHIARYLHIDQTSKIKISEDWPYGLYGEKQQNFYIFLDKIIKLLELYKDKIWIKHLPKNAQQQLSSLWGEFMRLQNPHPHPLLKKINQSHNLHALQNRLIPLQRIDYILWYLKTYLEHDEDYREALAQLKQPAEFIIGKQSVLYHYQGQLEISQKLAEHKIHLMQKSGHVPLLSEPFKFYKILTQFLHAD